MTEARGERSCSLCEQQFNSDRELQEHQSEAHPSEIADKDSGYSESHGAGQDDLRKSA
jgi:hypothetical protein